MALDFYESHGKVVLDTISSLYLRNSRKAFYKLVQRNHPADMAWKLRYLNSEEHRNIFLYVQRIDGLSAFLQNK